ncbi:YhbY family RNA-binding protein [Treponema porcinum]|uniref:YhbY family RNA-binding protein n=1 Tax=Treponema porcinum TaxID=261392 RepID=UPI0023522C88|nr:YhbY family RNA-binding protein [Treponema porcinum]
MKVKFNDFKDDKRELTENLCNSCGALLVRIIGNIAILYKEQENPEKRKIKI